MSTTTAADLQRTPMRELTIAEWHDLYGDYEGGHCELVRGQAIVTPSEALRNIRTARRLERLLEDRLPASLRPYRHACVLIHDEPSATTRVPDLSVLRTGLDESAWHVRPSDVVLVVEVVSPSSVERDRVTKRAEYAAVGIPNYLIVEVGPNDGPHLWLFETLVADDASGITTYAKPTGDGTTVTLHIPGTDPITITAADLTDALWP